MESNQLFNALKSILKPYEERLTVVHDEDTNYYLNTRVTNARKKPEFFGAVQVKKSFVSFHFMPVYEYPELLDDLSPVLKKSMQGKSCFNFKSTDDTLFSELRALTQKGFEKYVSLQKV
jgi:hypothetical protein